MTHFGFVIIFRRAKKIVNSLVTDDSFSLIEDQKLCVYFFSIYENMNKNILTFVTLLTKLRSIFLTKINPHWFHDIFRQEREIDWKKICVDTLAVVVIVASFYRLKYVIINQYWQCTKYGEHLHYRLARSHFNCYY